MHVPYFSQETLYSCGVASTRMVLDYYDIKKSESEVSKFIKNSPHGTDFSNIKIYVESLGLKCEILKIDHQDKGLKKLMQYLQSDIPVIVTVNRYAYDKKTPRIKEQVHWESDDYSYHIVVVTRIDKNLVYFNDPHKEIGMIYIPLETFLNAWYNKDYPGYCVVITPSTFLK